MKAFVVKWFACSMLISAIVLVTASCSTPTVQNSVVARGADLQKYEKCAVIVSDPERRMSEGMSAEIESVFSKAMLTRGYRVASRTDVAAALKEINFQQSGVTESQAAQIGRMLAVPGIMVVRVTELATNSQSYQGSTSYQHSGSVDARFIDVASAEIIWQSDSHERTGMFDRRDARSILRAAAEKAVHEFPSRGATGGGNRY